ncbi:tyrosine-type recombinase/integrase [Embleya sp. NPDC059237]|uniref:tyrosine-type recombinase/integrase n=1 Tax=Embleya sp. NPDC059237 TaxID=3346784 RepID=UPI0036A69D8B
MLKPSFKVRIWELRVHERAKGTTYEVRWKVGGNPCSKTYKTKGLADNRRAELLKFIQDGTAFDEISGLPMPEARALDDVTWYTHARDYIEMKWDASPAKTRTTLADALATATPVLVAHGRRKPTPEALRLALYGWAFNVNRWDEEAPPEVVDTLRWVKKHALPMSALDDAIVMRKVLSAFGKRLDGDAAAPSTVQRKRAIFHNALGFAVETRRLTANPLGTVQWTAPKVSEQVEPENVVNPRQADVLLDAVYAESARGRHLAAFFGCMYHAGMRPAEVVWLMRKDCVLPKRGWGVLKLRESRPRVGSAWTDDRKSHDKRSLKGRARKATRPVPIPPELVAMLRWHMYVHGTAPDGRLFRTARGGMVQESGYGEVWRRARVAALSAEQVESALAKRPYDLRHACVSLWLNSGVDPTEVARRAGHSVNVLLRVYAKCLPGVAEQANRKISEAMRQWRADGS